MGACRRRGESYTAARAQLLKQKPAATVSPRPSEYAKLAGRSDEIIKAKTGCTWERWVKALDRAKAHAWPHREIAKYVNQKYKVPGWWAQTVTAGYERIKGLRAVGQRRDGSFEASKSRTFGVPVSPGVDLTIRTSAREKSMRITWPDRTSLEVGFMSKGSDKSSVAVAHTKLTDRAAAAKAKHYWADRLDALKDVLM
ncbi:MAG TPA: hypothetical protein VIG08_17540 [Gemmatimonadales bacterium]